MQIQSEIITSKPLDASTVLILRDSQVQGGLEVFMIRRHAKSSVLGGAYVFPGGKVDAADFSAHLLNRVDADLGQLIAQLNEHDLSEQAAAALYIAAIRETFEESGVLLTHTPLPGGLAAQESAVAQNFATLVEQHAITLAVQDLVPFSRWITPKMPSVMSKRFDTRFFLVKDPQFQVAKHDNHEAVDSAWLSPTLALRRYWDNEIELAPPQIMSLANLARFESAAAAIEYARGRVPAFIQPEPFDVEGVRHICYPGHPRHSEQAPTMMGPKVLRFVNNRFEPIGGFDRFFED